MFWLTAVLGLLVANCANTFDPTTGTRDFHEVGSSSVRCTFVELRLGIDVEIFLEAIKMEISLAEKELELRHDFRSPMYQAENKVLLQLNTLLSQGASAAHGLQSLVTREDEDARVERVPFLIPLAVLAATAVTGLTAYNTYATHNLKKGGDQRAEYLADAIEKIGEINDMKNLLAKQQLDILKVMREENKRILLHEERKHYLSSFNDGLLLLHSIINSVSRGKPDSLLLLHLEKGHNLTSLVDEVNESARSHGLKLASSDWGTWMGLNAVLESPNNNMFQVVISIPAHKLQAAHTSIFRYIPSPIAHGNGSVIVVENEMERHYLSIDLTRQLFAVLAPHDFDHCTVVKNYYACPETTYRTIPDSIRGGGASQSYEHDPELCLVSLFLKSPNAATNFCRFTSSRMTPKVYKLSGDSFSVHAPGRNSEVYVTCEDGHSEKVISEGRSVVVEAGCTAIAGDRIFFAPTKRIGVVVNGGPIQGMWNSTSNFTFEDTSEIRNRIFKNNKAAENDDWDSEELIEKVLDTKSDEWSLGEWISNVFNNINNVVTFGTLATAAGLFLRCGGPQWLSSAMGRGGGETNNTYFNVESTPLPNAGSIESLPQEGENGANVRNGDV